jgi:predicted esterase
LTEAELGGVLIHGRHHSPEAMVDLSSRLNPINIRWIAPAAEKDRSWYPGVFTDPVSVNEPALTRAIERIDNAVEQASGNGTLGPNQLVMMGFSQGACLTVEYALRHPGRCRTLIVLTGGLIGPPGAEWPGSPTMLSRTRVLLTGSDADEWIPEARVHQTARVLRSFGAAVEERIYPGRPHEVSDAELVETSAFIRRLVE